MKLLKRTSTLGMHYTNEYVTFENGIWKGQAGECVVMWVIELECNEGKRWV